ncbi:hypothetical protein [Macrococcoides canis]|uniref:hypothetical protein n=1 Tax=Macrococcoides canis TaxID=1855823 RepID=UPI001B8B1320|nr:hypothetical protein [Macrococcus canis]QUR94235.1 hypothetical protein GOY09_04400 [Macrococcus canis]UTH07252.1 hypothetical protein KFV07_02160 [Macrococcus canis]
MTELKRSENYKESNVLERKTNNVVGQAVKVMDYKVVRTVLILLVIAFFVFRMYIQ